MHKEQKVWPPAEKKIDSKIIMKIQNVGNVSYISLLAEFWKTSNKLGNSRRQRLFSEKVKLPQAFQESP